MAGYTREGVLMKFTCSLAIPALLLCVHCGSKETSGSTMQGADGGGDAGPERGHDAARADAEARADVVTADAVKSADVTDASVDATTADVLRGGTCGGISCKADQVCVEPTCCPSCGPLPESGPCPDGSAVGMCLIGGSQSCIVPCTPPPAYCVDVTEPCAGSSCDCVADSGCGLSGGICSGSSVLQCIGCY